MYGMYPFINFFLHKQRLKIARRLEKLFRNTNLYIKILGRMQNIGKICFYSIYRY